MTGKSRLLPGGRGGAGPAVTVIRGRLGLVEAERLNLLSLGGWEKAGPSVILRKGKSKAAPAVT
jgi:hypothetical protein